MIISKRSIQFSIIIPVLNEAERIGQTLESLQEMRRNNVEVIVVDGGSQDGSADRAEASADLVIKSPTGRAVQMNRGARAAKGEYLLFLHADTQLPNNALPVLLAFVQRETVWGRFDVRLSGSGLLYRVIGCSMNWRSRITGIATGDQAIFVRTCVFHRVAGYPEIPLMEDIALCKKLKQLTSPVCIKQKVITSSRRWQKYGIFRTVFRMWYLRFRFFLGTDPKQLAQLYS